MYICIHIHITIYYIYIIYMSQKFVNYHYYVLLALVLMTYYRRYYLNPLRNSYVLFINIIIGGGYCCPIISTPGACCSGICMGLARDNPNQDNQKKNLIYREYWVAPGLGKNILAEIKLSNISNNILILF